MLPMSWDHTERRREIGAAKGSPAPGRPVAASRFEAESGRQPIAQCGTNIVHVFARRAFDIECKQASER